VRHRTIYCGNYKEKTKQKTKTKTKNKNKKKLRHLGTQAAGYRFPLDIVHLLLTETFKR
jgi:hypothetical protein